jgi:triosephosphate isomerase
LIVAATRYLIGMSTKMYFSHARTLQWCRDVAELSRRHPAVTTGTVELFVLPGFLSITEVAKIIPSVGAQDVSWAEEGPYTGEVSAAQLAEVGARFVEVGHAERRRLFGEDDAIVAAKTAAVLRHGLAPVLCVGETDRGTPRQALGVCQAQIDAALATARQHSLRGRVVIAYEPVWAIGAAEPAAAGYITEVCGPLRTWLAQDTNIAGAVIYGGSAGPGLLRQIGEHVDGLFLGRFAHDARAISGILDDISFLTGTDPADSPRRPRSSR